MAEDYPRHSAPTSSGTSKMRVLRWLAVVAWALVLFGLSSIPGSQIPSSDVPSADKWVHLSLYAVMGVLCARAVRGSFTRSSGRAAVAAVLMSLAYGISDEIHQIWVPGRSPDPMDALADLGGGVIGAAVFAFWLARMRRASRHRPPGVGDETQAR